VRLSREFARALPKTLVYEHPSLQKLTEHLLEVLFPASSTELSRTSAEKRLDPAGRDPMMDTPQDEISRLLDEELATLPTRC
jgi:hypothetical protein